MIPIRLPTIATAITNIFMIFYPPEKFDHEDFITNSGDKKGFLSFLSMILTAHGFCFQHAVTNADFGKDILRGGGIFFDFPPYIGHVYAKDFRIVSDIRAPHILHDGCICQDLS